MSIDLVAQLTLVDNLTAPLRKANQAMDQASKAADSYRDANGRLRDANGKFIKDTHNSIDATNRFGGSLGKLPGIAGTVVASLGALVTAGAGVAYAFSSVNKAMDMESQMSTIKALTGATGDEMKRMTDLAMDLGAQTKYSALEAAQGIEELLKAGITPAQVEAGALESALNLATAGGLDLAKSAEIMSTALNAFKDDGMDASDAANILAGTANASATGVLELQYSLSQVSAVASGVGLSFKDTNLALGLFANNSLKGGDAGTSLKTMLSRLTPMTNQATEQFQALGLMTEKGTSAFYDANGEIRSMAEIAGLLQTSMKDLNSEQRQQAMYTMFGSDAIRASNILFKEGAKGVKDFEKEMSNVTALDVAKEKMNNASGAVEEFGGAMETMQIAVMMPLLPLIKEVATELADFVGGIDPAKFAEFGQTATDGFTKVYDISKSVFNFFTDNWPLISNVLVGATTATITFKSALLALSVYNKVKKWAVSYHLAMTAMTISQTGLNAAMRANPIGLVITAITLLVTAGVLLYKNWETVEKVWGKVWDGMKTGAEVSVNAMVSAINLLIKTINLIPGVKVPLIPKVDFSGAESLVTKGGRTWDKVQEMPTAKSLMTPKAPPKSTNGAMLNPLDKFTKAPGLSVGLARVKAASMPATIHYDEAVLTASQSNMLRGMGVLQSSGDRPVIDVNAFRAKGVHDYKPSQVQNAEVKTTREQQRPNINIAKMADTIVIREEADMDKFADAHVRKLIEAYELGAG